MSLEEEGKQLNLNLEEEYVMSFSITPTIGSESNDFVMGMDYPVIRPDIDIGEGDVLNKGTVFVNGRTMTVTRMDGKFMVTSHKVSSDPVVKAWGLVPTFIPPDKGCPKFREWLWDALEVHTSLVVNTCSDADILAQNMTQRFRCFKPFQSELNSSNIALYPNIEKFLAGREVSMKAGKALKLMIPELSQVDLDLLVDSFRSNFDQREFTLHTSKLADKFELAYNGDQVPMQNPSTTYTRKSLACSCMRKNCDEFQYNVDEHPSRAYASGDFSIIYTESNGKIGSRCTVWTHQDGEPIIPQAAPIYGTCEHSIDMIANKLREMGAVFSNDACWIGAKLRRIPFEGNDDQFIGPYLDLSPQHLKDTGKYLIVSENGEIDGSEYNGVLGDTYDCYCDDCGCGLGEDEYRYSDYYETTYCDDCYDNAHAHCELAGEDYPRDEVDEILCSNGRTIQAWREHEDVVEACDGNLWVHEDTMFCEYDETYVPSYDLIKYDYFQSDWDNEVYPMSECCTLADCSSVSKDELDNDGNDWVLDKKAGTWSPITEGEDE